MEVGRSALMVPRDRRMTAAVVGSILVHVGALSVALVFNQANADKGPLIKRDVVKVRIARLGEVRDKRLLPRKVKTPPPPKPSAPLPVKTEKPLPKPATPPPPKPKTEPLPTPERNDDLLAAAIAKVAGEVDPKADPNEPLPGIPDGDPMGDSTDTTEGDLYLGLVRRSVRSNYEIPDIISDRERMFLNADVVIYVGHDGSIIRRELERSSGNDHFDAALLRAVDKSNPLPPPPPDFRDDYREDGIGLKFKI